MAQSQQISHTLQSLGNEFGAWYDKWIQLSWNIRFELMNSALQPNGLFPDPSFVFNAMLADLVEKQTKLEEMSGHVRGLLREVIQQRMQTIVLDFPQSRPYATPAFTIFPGPRLTDAQNGPPSDPRPFRTFFGQNSSTAPVVRPPAVLSVKPNKSLLEVKKRPINALKIESPPVRPALPAAPLTPLVAPPVLDAPAPVVEPPAMELVTSPVVSDSNDDAKSSITQYFDADFQHDRADDFVSAAATPELMDTEEEPASVDQMETDQEMSVPEEEPTVGTGPPPLERDATPTNHIADPVVPESLSQPVSSPTPQPIPIKSIPTPVPAAIPLVVKPSLPVDAPVFIPKSHLLPSVVSVQRHEPVILGNRPKFGRKEVASYPSTSAEPEEMTKKPLVNGSSKGDATVPKLEEKKAVKEAAVPRLENRGSDQKAGSTGIQTSSQTATLPSPHAQQPNRFLASRLELNPGKPDKAHSVDNSNGTQKTLSHKSELLEWGNKPKPVASLLHPRYKTMPCKRILEKGSCYFGKQCYFLHPEDETNLSFSQKKVTPTNGLAAREPTNSLRDHSPTPEDGPSWESESECDLVLPHDDTESISSSYNHDDLEHLPTQVPDVTMEVSSDNRGGRLHGVEKWHSEGASASSGSNQSQLMAKGHHRGTGNAADYKSVGLTPEPLKIPASSPVGCGKTLPVEVAHRDVVGRVDDALIIVDDWKEVPDEQTLFQLDFASLGFSQTLVAGLSASDIHCPSLFQAAFLAAFAQGLRMLVQGGPGIGKTSSYVMAIINKLDPNGDYTQAVIITETADAALKVFNMFLGLGAYSNIRLLRCREFGSDFKELGSRRVGKVPQVIIGTSDKLMPALIANHCDFNKVHTLVADEVCEMFAVNRMSASLQDVCSALPNTQELVIARAFVPDQLMALTEECMASPMKLTLDKPTKFH